MLTLVGINHRSAPIEVRERLAFPKSRLADALTTLVRDAEVEGAIILSTCNRVEIYADVQNSQGGAAVSKRFLLSYHRLHDDEMESYLYTLVEREATRHLFRVAAGLDSQILGENEIQGQVKQAYQAAREAGTTNRFLDRLFSKALSVGKQVRARTRISEGVLSIGSLAVQTAERELGTLRGRRVLLIGAGEVAELVVRSFLANGFETVIVANRTYERARQLALELHGKAIRFDHLDDALRWADVVISATAAPHLVLGQETVQAALEDRQHPLLIIDLAIPRDVDPRVKELSGVSLYDLGDLDAVIEENRRKRQAEAQRAEALVEEAVERFYRSLAGGKR